MVEEKSEVSTQETGMLGEVEESDFVKPTEEQDTSIDIRETKPEETVKTERPEDLPVEFWDEDSGAFKSNELFEGYKKEKDKALGLRQQLSKGMQKAPKDSSEYEIDLIELQESSNIDIPDDDAGMKIAREAALESGLSKSQFKTFVGKYMKDMVDSGAMERPQHQELSKEQIQEDNKKYIEDEKQKLGDNGEQIIGAIKNWGKQQVHNGVFSEDDYKSFLDLGHNANSIRVLNLLRKSSGDLSIPTNVQPIDGLSSREEIDGLIASPDYESNRESQRKVTEYFQKLHPPK